MTTSMTLNVPLEISFERLQDLMVLCIEHFGYGSFNFEGVRRSPCDKDVDSYDLPLTETSAIYFKDKYDEDSEEEFVLDRKAVETGLILMSQKYTKHFTDFINENDDVITGDVFLQCALLGDVVYG